LYLTYSGNICCIRAKISIASQEQIDFFWQETKEKDKERVEEEEVLVR
jgi:hypothetical protein